MAGLPEPPVTPISSTASSFLSFSPDGPDTPSASIYSPESTPRAHHRRPSAPTSRMFSSSSPIKLEAPPQRRRAESLSTLLSSSTPGDIFGDGIDISPVTVDFSSRNPFAAFVTARSTSPSSSFSTSPSNASSLPDVSTSSPTGSSSSSLSNASTPTQDSLDDDLVVYDGNFIGQEGDVVFEGFGVVNTGDLSSSWEDELYSSLSDSAPSSPTTSRPFYPASPSKTPRLRSPRKGASTAPSPRHPFRHGSTTSPARRSPHRSRASSPAVSRPQSRAARPATSRTSSSTSPGPAQLDSGFQLLPTSPVYQQQREQASRSPFSNFALAPSPFSRFSPPKSRKSPTSQRKTTTSSVKNGAAFALEQKLAARAQRRQERLVREQAEEGRPLPRTAEGFDLEALDRFFGVTPKHGKAMRGGYGGLAVQEGMVGSEAVEAEQWRRVEDFRSLLAQEETTDEDGYLSSAADLSDTEDDFHDQHRSTRRRPPPLTLAHSSHSRSASASTSISLASPCPVDLLSPIALTPAPQSSSFASPNPLAQENRHRGQNGASQSGPRGDMSMAVGKKLKHQQSMGNRLKGLFIGGK
ncbi:hypothetical protein JCM11251_001470 [Rhodosporidiobolus azoricus]